jgi:hypothetical protein
MSLEAFFAAVQPYLAGQVPSEKLREAGPTSASKADLAFYPWLVAHDQQRILAELLPLVKRWVERVDGDWPSLVKSYVHAHPPAGFSVPTVGDRFADWLASSPAEHPWLPAGIEAVADLGYTRFLARTALDGDDVGVDRRIFVRQYPLDPVATERALRNEEDLPQTGATTWVVFRHEPSGRPRVLSATLASIAVLVAASGAPLQGALALPADVLDAERERLTQRGVLPQPPGVPCAS